MQGKWMARLAALAVAAMAAGCSDGVTDLPGLEVHVLEVTPGGEIALTVGDTLRLTARPKTVDGTQVAGLQIGWATESSQVAELSAIRHAGYEVVIRATAPGTTRLHATAGGRTTTVTVSVTAAFVPVHSVRVSPDSLLLAHGAAATLEAVVRAADGTVLSGRTVAWSSANAAIAEVDATGRVTARGAGVVVIRAESEGVVGQGRVVVPGPSLRIDSDSLALTVGDTVRLRAIVLDGAGQPAATPVLWERIAEDGQGLTVWAIDGRALVRAQGIGRFRLVARTAGGLADTLVVRSRAIERNLVSIDAGFNASCGLDGDGRGYCWGMGTVGGIGSLWTHAPAPLGGNVRFASIHVGHQHGCGLGLDGRAYCWGMNDLGPVGSDIGFAATPTPVAGHRVFASIATVGWHTCGLTPGGDLYCWGTNEFGQLGDGSQVQRRTPVQSAGGRRFASIAVGSWHACGLDFDGVAYCWGSNSYGQLGRGAVGGIVTDPMPVLVDVRFTHLAVGGTHSCGIATDGAAYCWGGNYYGQLGSGSTAVQSAVPVAVAGGHRFTSLSAGWHTCGTTVGGDVYCWGQNDAGGNGIEPQQSGSCLSGDTQLTHYYCNRSPVRVANGPAFASVSVGGWHTCGMSVDGRPFCWGEDFNGQLGQGYRMPAGYSARPLQVRDGRLREH